MLTEQQTSELKRLKQYFPYRICWGMIDKETGEWLCFANFTKRQMNDAVRKGHSVFSIQ